MQSITNLANLDDHTYYMEIDAAGASAVMDLYRYPYNRPIKPSRVQLWLSDMNAGRWKLSTLEFLRTRTDRHPFMVNGHHRMLSQSQCERSHTYRVQIETVPTFSEIEDQYRVIDSPSSGRIFHEVLGQSDLASLPATFRTHLKSAVALVVNNFRQPPAIQNTFHQLGYSGQIREVGKWKDVGAQYYSLLPDNSSLRRGLVSTPAFAVGLVTFQSSPDTAERFWREIADDDGLVRGSGSWLANRYIRESVWSKGIQAAYRCRYIAGCWNAFARGEQISKVIPNVTKPIRIEGSEYVG